jgi:hypothetical protein
MTPRERFNEQRRHKVRIHFHKLYTDGWGQLLIDPACSCLRKDERYA